MQRGGWGSDGVLFQSTLPRRERRFPPPHQHTTRQFQSTLPRRERHGTAPAPSSCPNFNPRSRVGSDKCFSTTLYIFQNFNPRSRVGSDQVTLCRKQFNNDFNPRSRVGSDRVSRTNSLSEVRISIHAPA